MPTPGSRRRYQPAVLWEKAGDDRHGRPLLGDPVEVRVRWVARKKEALSPSGEMIGVDATAEVDRKISLGSIMWQGKLTDWSGAGDLLQVMAYNEVPDLKARDVVRQVMLVRYSASLPAHV